MLSYALNFKARIILKIPFFECGSVGFLFFGCLFFVLVPMGIGNKCLCRLEIGDIVGPDYKSEPAGTAYEKSFSTSALKLRPTGI